VAYFKNTVPTFTWKNWVSHQNMSVMTARPRLKCRPRASRLIVRCSDNILWHIWDRINKRRSGTDRCKTYGRRYSWQRRNLRDKYDPLAQTARNFLAEFYW